MFRFKCASCGEWHEGMPSFGADAPLYFYGIPAAERDARCVLTGDTCVIDEEHFFIRGCLDIPVAGTTDPFRWGVWVSLSRTSFGQFVACFETPVRAHVGPFFGWLSTELALYPSTVNLKTHVHLRDNGIRPFIELEPTSHPLAVEQRTGITADRVGEIVGYYERNGDS